MEIYARTGASIFRYVYQIGSLFWKPGSQPILTQAGQKFTAYFDDAVASKCQLSPLKVVGTGCFRFTQTRESKGNSASLKLMRIPRRAS